jgi:hypothetical protein
MGNKLWAGFTLKELLSEPKYHGEQNVYVKELLREPEKSQLGTKGTTLERTNHIKTTKPSRPPTTPIPPMQSEKPRFPSQFHMSV